ncbi:hypothetical protein CPT_Matapan_037 [Salmonella phage Matapan]|nr:hypothetical protein CPT_Matapan_037 [Salmonella phage Matapan]
MHELIMHKRDKGLRDLGWSHNKLWGDSLRDSCPDSESPERTGWRPNQQGEVKILRPRQILAP